MQTPVRPGLGVLNLLQAAVYVGGAVYLSERWVPVAVLIAIAAIAQVVSGGMLLAGRGPKWSRWAGVYSLLCVGLLLGLYLQVGVHIVRTFTPIGAKTGWALMGGAALGALVASLMPLLQIFVLPGAGPGQRGSASVGFLAALLIPPLAALPLTAPDQRWQEQDGAQAVSWAWAHWHGEDSQPALGDAQILGVLHVLQGGEIVQSIPLNGPLGEALAQARPRTPPGERAGMVLELALASTPLRHFPLENQVPLLSPGQDALLSPQGVRGSLEIWRKPQVGRRILIPPLRLPAPSARLVPGATHRVQMQSWVISEAGLASLERTWSAPAELSQDSARSAALAGAHMVSSNMRADGRYAYIVKGPSGDWGRGYNYPRHAGGTWFLARVYSRTGDAQAKAGALAGVAHLKSVSQTLPDGRAFVLDPSRRDGKAWVGTTALALMALTELGVEPELQQAYADFIASAVDAQGVVRGDMTVESGLWPEQPQVTYAQGQGLLALAGAERAGLSGVKDALTRAIDYVEGDYWPMPAARFGMLDEHWMCLASVTVQEVRGLAAGEAICTAYLADVALLAPTPGSPIQPSAGPAAGLAEAVIARAELDRRAGVDGPYKAKALEYAASLLANQYQPTDAPLLGEPQRLIGGFRDQPWELDVQVDAVQHIGCALLGAEQLMLGQDIPGAMP